MGVRVLQNLDSSYGCTDDISQTVQRSALRIEGLREGGLLSRVDGQVIELLDLDPSNDVVALERVKRGKPGRGVLVALFLVEVVGDGNQLGPGKIVGELLAESGGPSAGSANPSFLQRNQVVLRTRFNQNTGSEMRGSAYDVEIGSQGCGDIVVRRNPVTGGGGTLRICDDVRTVPLQNG